MKKIIHRAWRHLLFAGIVSLLFGIVAFVWPLIPLYTFIWLFAITIILQGISICVGAFEAKKEESNWWLLLLYGLLFIVTGVVAAAYPGITAILLGFIISINLIAGGLLQIVMAIHLRKEIRGEGWMALSGLITLAGGIYLLMLPGGGALAMLWFIATIAIIAGVILIALALKARTWFRNLQAEIKEYRQTAGG